MTYEEAEDKYYYYKKKYSDAAYCKRASENKENTLLYERKIKNASIENMTSQKLNLEKRLAGIESIIKRLGGNVSGVITKANSALSKADASYKGSIKLYGGVTVADLGNIFKLSGVEADSRSEYALDEYKKERDSVSQKISELKNNISSLSDTVDDLTRQINACSITQASLRTRMNSYAYSMNYYRRYML